MTAYFTAISCYYTPVQRRVMVNCGLVSRVVVIGEKVEEVERPIESINGIALTSILQ